MISNSIHFPTNDIISFVLRRLCHCWLHTDPVPTIVVLKELVVWTNPLSQDPCRLFTFRTSGVLSTWFPTQGHQQILVEPQHIIAELHRMGQIVFFLQTPG